MAAGPGDPAREIERIGTHGNAGRNSGSRLSLLNATTLATDEHSAQQRQPSTRQVAPAAASQQDLERPIVPPLSGVRTRPPRELPSLAGCPRRGSAEEAAPPTDGTKGGMLHAQRKSQSPPCSAKAGGGGGDIGRYRSASFIDEEFKVDDLELDEPIVHRPWWRRLSVWMYIIPALLSAIVVAAAILMRIFNNVRIIRSFELWRWAFFVGMIFPVWLCGSLLTFILIRIVEAQFLTTRNVLYFMAAVRKPLAKLLRVALIFPVYVPLFGPRAGEVGGAAWIVYDNILKFLACLLIFTFANVVATLLSKALASHFHKSTHFDKMQQAIRNEYWLQVLATPRPGSLVAHLDEDGDEAGVGALNPRSIYKNIVAPIKQAAAQPYVPLPRPARAVSVPSPAPAPSPFEPLADDLAAPASCAPPEPLSTSHQEALLPAKSAPVAAEADRAAPGGARKPVVPDAPAAAVATERSWAAPAAGSAVAAVAGAVPDPPEGPGHRVSGFAGPATAGASPGASPLPSPGRRLSAPVQAVEHYPRGFVQPPPPPLFREGPRATHPLAAQLADGPAAAQACAPSQRTVAAWAAGADAGAGGGAAAAPSATPGGTSERSAPAVQSSQSSLAQLLAGAYTQKLLHPGAVSTAGAPAGGKSHRTPRGPSPPGTAKADGAATGRVGSVAQCEGASVLSGSEATRTQPPKLVRSGAGERTLAAQLHAVAKHLRKNPIGGATFAQALGSTAASKRAASCAGERQARRLALYIYWNVKGSQDRNHIEREDLEAFLPADQAAEAFAMLNQDGDECLTLSEVREAIVGIFRERRNLAVQLKDTKSVVGRLKAVLLVLLHLLAAFFYLVIYNVDIQKLWVFISSVIIASAFVFGNSVKQLFESVVFLFFVHPYDVGDCLLIEGSGARTGKFFVEEISLSTTVMRRSDGTRHWYPNPKLVVMPILNLTRSDPQYCSFKIMVDLTAPMAVVEAVDAAVAACLAAAPAEFTGARIVALDERGAAGDANKAALDISYELSHSGVDTRRTLAARSAVVRAVGDALSRAGVYYSMPPQQPYPDTLAPRDGAVDEVRR